MVRFKTDAIILKDAVCEVALRDLPSLLSARDLSLLARNLAGARPAGSGQDNLRTRIRNDDVVRESTAPSSYFTENKAYAGLGRASLHSGMIFVIARGGNIFVQLASTILLARILSPHDFGVVAVVLALVGFAPMLIDLGTSEASTQKTLITPQTDQHPVLAEHGDRRCPDRAPDRQQRADRADLRRACDHRHRDGALGHLCADGDVQPALRADAPRHAVSSHRDRSISRPISSAALSAL